MLRAVATLAEHEPVIVAGEFQRGGHLLIRQWPVAKLPVQIVLSTLQEDPNRLPGCLADEGGVIVAATDIRKAAHKTQHFPERIGTLPGDRPRADRAGTAATDRPQIRVVGQVVVDLHFRDDLLQQESRVTVAERIVLDLARLIWKVVGYGLTRRDARVDEEADGNGHFASMNQVVGNDRHANDAVGLKKTLPILEDHQTCRVGRVVLCRYVDPVVMDSSGIDMTVFPNMPGDPACWDACLRLGVRPQYVLAIRIGRFRASAVSAHRFGLSAFG